MLKNIILLALLFLFSCSEKKTEADLIVHNAIIYSVDSSFTIYKAMAIKDGKILELNSEIEILKKYSSHQVIDAKGKSVFPGFTDAHCHFTGFATDMWKCNVTGTKSFEEVISKIIDYSKNAPMTWIYGRGWDQNDWENKEFPNKNELDRLFPDRPVFLKRVDGHAALVNQKALDLTGVNANTKIEGGLIEIKNGKLTGILLDNAMDLVDLKIPIINDSLAKHYYQKAQEICFALGLTQVHDCGVTEHTINLIDEAQKSGNLKMKIFALLSDDSTYYEPWLKKGIYKTDRLTVGGFKIYSDGALGSRGACLLESYNDKENWKGFLLTDKKRLHKIADQLINSPFQFCTHAIGDSANRYMLKLYASVLKGKNNHRWRIEHAQVLNPEDFYMFEKYDIFPSVQPTHATSDMYWAEARLGKERVKTAYAYKQLLKVSGRIALGTDFPVEDISPLKTFFAAVARQDSNGFPANGFQKENALSREETLKGMTIWAAHASFEENEKGSLEKNKLADFIILDTDLMKCNLKEILKTKVLATYINGEKVFSIN
ncbi:amidohydrolase [Aurantibacillus circumpalustris]|uniref:amidohydrolase n=1 Tax=Aurantibacillus circumpalustris TaxID=3036359 RepID=UPI00295B33AE|nr:amidohydrolase family protein [Aurantibacillus circumpalustris]